MVDFDAILKKYWGYDSFRPLQAEAIRSVAAGRDTLVLMPTGGGKSLVFQVPALALEGVCVVITPLIALMKDQTDALRRRGIPAAAIHAGMTPRQIDIALDNCVYGDCKFLYVSPERIDSELFRARFARMTVSLVVVDEAHCISQWGYDFRPAYLKIARLRPLAPAVPVLALTASATPAVVADIEAKLEFRASNVLRMSFGRANLSYVVRPTENKPEQLLRVIRNTGGSGIVYVRTRERAERVAELLVREGIAADFYHGGLGHLMRGIRQDRWIKGESQVMVATNAFGMGIDKADVRTVVHLDLCDSPEAYYQEAGRAGRDGRPAYAVLLVSEQDRASAAGRIDLEFPPVATIRRVYEAVGNWFQIPVGGGADFASDFNIYDFARRERLFVPTVTGAIKILQLNGYLMLTEETDHPARVVFTLARDELYRVQVERAELDHFIKVLLRACTGIFTELVAIDEQRLAHLSGYTTERVHELLKRLWQLRIIKYIPGRRAAMIVYLDERLPQDNLRISPESYRLRREVAEERLRAMTGYAALAEGCRSLFLQRYFGDDATEPCGKCDLCRARERRLRQGSAEASATLPSPTPRTAILARLAGGGCTLHELVAAISGEPAAILDEIRALTAEGLIVQRPDGGIEAAP